MLKVRTRLGKSPIHGIGLFADEPIAEGTVIWDYDPRFDLTFVAEDLGLLSAPAREQVEKYSYFEEEIGAYILCGDDARFMNHSPTPNAAEVPGVRTVAARAIAAGEEITCNYADLSPAEFLGFAPTDIPAAE
jgi:SET domain-containing protein